MRASNLCGGGEPRERAVKKVRNWQRALRRREVQSDEGRAMDCVTVETTAYSVASHQRARFRLVYEVAPFRDGLECWFLVAMEELQAALARNPVETESVEAVSFRG